MTDHVLEQAEQILVNVATKHQRSYSMVELEDLKQELRLSVFENVDRYEDLLDPRQETAEYKKSCERVRKDLRNAAEKFCRKEKAAKAGYETHDEQFYGIGMLRKLLPAFLDNGLTEHPPADREQSVTKGGGLASERGNWQAMMSDLDYAYTRLSQYDQHVIRRYYSEPDSVKAQQIAYELGMTEDQLHGKLRRAIARLQRSLGGSDIWKQGPGSRKAVSNARAQAETRNAY